MKTTMNPIRPDAFRAALASTRTSAGATLEQLCADARVLVVFLRHGGCTFCREALEDLRRDRATVEKDDVRLVLVHMMSDEDASHLFARYGLDDVPRVSDPERELYRAFGLQQGRISQLLAWKVWWRGLVAGVLRGHGGGRLQGDGRQMPGVFLLRDSRIVRAFRHRTAADRPDYAATCTVVTP